MSIKRLLKIPVRTDWDQFADGRWHMSLGVRGCRVRVTQREPGSAFVAVTWIGRRRVQVSLKTSKRPEAQRLAEAYLLKLHERDKAPEQPLTLERLWALYREGSAGYRQNTERTRRDKVTAARRLLVALGEKKRVDHLTLNDVERYLGMRKTGSGWPDGRSTEPVGPRAAADDLCLLRAMILWATRERKADGAWLLAENPLRGMKLPREENPCRPVATFERFQKLRAAAQELSNSRHDERTRSRWVRFELALVIAEATAARIGSIRGLRWSDIDLGHRTIRWNREFHKRRRESVVPITPELAEELRGFRTSLGAVGDAWLFPTVSGEQPWSREIFRELWIRAEERAEIPHMKGGCWHTLRRKWAIERKSLPPVDVAGAGGWKDLAVLQTIYQIATPEGMLEVMAHPAKLRERAIAAD